MQDSIFIHDLQSTEQTAVNCITITFILQQIQLNTVQRKINSSKKESGMATKVHKLISQTRGKTN